MAYATCLTHSYRFKACLIDLMSARHSGVTKTINGKTSYTSLTYFSRSTSPLKYMQSNTKRHTFASLKAFFWNKNITD